MDALLTLWLFACCEHYGVDPAFAKAVMLVESGGRCGPLGKSGRFIGPFGIEKSFRRKWAIDNPFVNVQVGVAALRGKDKRRVLKRYNTAFTEPYYRAIMAAYRRGR